MKSNRSVVIENWIKKDIFKPHDHEFVFLFLFHTSRAIGK